MQGDVLVGGLQAWKDAGYATQTKAEAQAAE
jgi:3-mercaptopyruvate sulfurtransferase SseA